MHREGGFNPNADGYFHKNHEDGKAALTKIMRTARPPNA